jgi:outer membrane receptor for ferrienterochelin and colicins
MLPRRSHLILFLFMLLLSLAHVRSALCEGQAGAEPQRRRQRHGRQALQEPAHPCKIHGTVRDVSGAAVPGATLVLDPGGETTTSADDGTFCFTSAHPETRQLMAIVTGFRRQWLPVDMAAAKEVTVVLQPAGTDEVITVTATRTEKRLEDVPIRTEVILPKTIELSASRTLADAVEFTTGIRVENECQNCNFTQIRMLGLLGPYTQILFDGEPTMSSLAQVYGVEQIPARMVDQVEVVKGGGSALYGPGAVAGVINVIPHRPPKTRGFFESRLEWMKGVPDRSLSAQGDWVSKSNETYMTAFGQSDLVRPVDVDGDGFTEVARRRFNAAGFRFGSGFLGQKAQLTLDLSHVREDRRGGDRLDLPEHEATVAESIRTRGTGFGVTWRHAPSARYDYRLAFSFSGTNRDTYYGSGMDPKAYGYSNSPLWIADAQVNHFLGSQIISWGGQLTSEGVQDAQPAYNRAYDVTYRNLGGFVQDDWSFAEDWELVYGLRIDKHSQLDHAVLSPRAALMWSPGKDLNVRWSVAKGFIAPRVFDEDLHITQVGGSGQVIRNDRNLREEGSTSLMFGAEWRAGWGPGSALLECNLFRTSLRNLFHAVEADDPATPEAEFTRTNLGSAQVYGIEFNFGYAIGPDLAVQFGLVEQRAKFGLPEPDFGSRDFFRTPNRYGMATLRYKKEGWFELFVGTKFESPSRVPHYAGWISADRLERTPAWGAVDASITRDFRIGTNSTLSLSIGGKNLADRYQDDFDQGAMRDAGYLWGPRFPRSVYLSASVSF